MIKSASPHKLICLSLVEAGEGELPTEFRVFQAGVNESTKGPVLYDDKARASVLAYAQKHGVDLMMDLEHLSLDQESRAYDPDARAWYRFEDRNGELWAVDVKWAPDGERRLREKTQRYTSPAFRVDKKNRVVEVLNIALCAMPATHNALALVAASRIERLSKMDPEQLKKAIEIIKNGDAEAALGVLEEMLVIAAAGKPEGDSSEETPAQDPPPDEASAAVVEKMLSVVGATDATQALEVLQTWKSDRDGIVSQKSQIDLASRRTLIGKLVALSVETPATAWKGDPSERQPCDRLMAEKLEDMRERVVKLSVGRGETTPDPKAPAANLGTGKGAVVTLSVAEKAMIKKRGLDEEEVLKKKAVLHSRTFWMGAKP